VVSHGAFQLLLEGHLDAVAPAERAADLADLARTIEPGPSGSTLAAALPAKLARELLLRAVLPDRFYRAAARREATRQPQAMAIYLPAVDLLAEGWIGGDVALADLVRTELEETDDLIGELAQGAGVLVVVLDPGRRSGREGRVIFASLGGAPAPGESTGTASFSCRAGGEMEVEPGAIASAMMRSLGLPQSAELPEPPALCRWPDPPGRVLTYGERRPTFDLPGASDDYLENLRSLGYL
jgi:hypothetical protein